MQHQTYTDLVKNEDDIVGRLAYAIYKSEKLNWIKSFEVTHQRPPSDQEVFDNFHHTVRGKLTRYRNEATQLINDYTDDATKEKLSLYKAQLKDDAVVKAVNKGWIRAITENVIAGAIGAAIVVLFNTGYWLYKQAPEGAAAKAAAQALAPDAPASASK